MDLTNITTTFGLLDTETQDALRMHFLHDGEIERFGEGGEWWPDHRCMFLPSLTYRAKFSPKKGEATFTGTRRAYFSIFSGLAECYDSYPDRLRFTIPTDDGLIRAGVYTDADGREVIIEEIGAADA
jgi:hypothetical protein